MIFCSTCSNKFRVLTTIEKQIFSVCSFCFYNKSEDRMSGAGTSGWMRICDTVF